jgi:hypothetical protein
LDAQERADLDARLYWVNRQVTDADTARLAGVLREFLASDTLYLTPDSPGRWERWLRRIRAYGSRWLTARRLKVAIVGSLSLLGLVGPLAPSETFYLEFDLPSGSSETVSDPVPITYLDFGHLIGILAMLGLGGVVGLLLMVAAILLVIGRERRGSSLGYFGLLLSLTTVAPINFYFSQFGAISIALAQFALLMGVSLYRRRDLVQEPGSHLPGEITR